MRMINCGGYSITEKEYKERLAEIEKYQSYTEGYITGYNNSNSVEFKCVNTGWDGEIDYENRYHDIMYSGGSVADVSAANAIVVQVQKQGGWITLSAPVGEVASKIAVGNDYEWCRERQDIDSKWHLRDGTKTFSDFVRGITIGKDWYQMVIAEAAKYQNKKNQ